jgi:hypothetical protein
LRLREKLFFLKLGGLREEEDGERKEGVVVEEEVEEDETTLPAVKLCDDEVCGALPFIDVEGRGMGGGDEGGGGFLRRAKRKWVGIV